MVVEEKYFSEMLEVSEVKEVFNVFLEKCKLDFI